MSTKKESEKKIKIRAVGDWPDDRVNDDGDIILSGHDLRLLRSIGETSSYKHGESIYSQGSECDNVWLVLSGFVKIIHTAPDGKQVVLAFYWQGDIFGLGDKGEYIHTATAGSATSLIRFERSALRSMLLQEPRLGNDMLLKVTAELRLSMRHALLLSYGPSDRRCAAFLAQASQYPGCFDQKTSTLNFPFSRDDIAEYLALRIESVSRAFTELERRKLIHRVSARKIHLSMERLQRFAEGV